MHASRRGSRRGQGLVEFALIMPLFLTLVFGIIDFSYYIFGWTTTQFAARRGAEQASIKPPIMIKSSYSTTDLAGDPCLRQIYDRVKDRTTFVTPDDNEIALSWFESTGTSISAMSALPKNQDALVVPRSLVEVSVQNSAEPLTPLGVWLFDGPFLFEAHSRRTILNIDVDPYNNC
jgi:hypothetical protein